jgi:hypothetical protein
MTGESLMKELGSIMEREGAFLGATVMRNLTNQEVVAVGHSLNSATIEIDRLLAGGYRPIGVFVLTMIDELSFKTLILTSTSLRPHDEPVVKKLIHGIVKSLFHELSEERIVKA